MARKSISQYTPDWPDVAKAAKEQAGWKCERCGAPNDRASGHVLTVHHLTMDPANNRWWNLATLCQRCHLTIQARVVMERTWLYEHSDWFKPHAAGYYAYINGLPDDRDYVMAHLEELLRLGVGTPGGAR